MTDKKSVALVFGITDNYVFALANTLIGLKRYNKPFWDDIIVYHNGVSGDNQAAVNRIVNVTFCLISKSDYDFISGVNRQSLEKYSVATFYRYECFKLLGNYETVIWSDVDILITGDISGLVEYGKVSGFAANFAQPQFLLENSLKKLVPDYDMYKRLINAGLLVFHNNPALDNNSLYEYCIETTVKYADAVMWPDLAVLNFMFQKFNIDVEAIGDEYCCHPSSNDVRNAKIVHAYGDDKFWNNSAYKIKFPEWHENNEEWENIRGESVISFPGGRPLVSCVMSTYNDYSFLRESIISILEQTYSNFEFIIVLEKSETQNKVEEILLSFNDDRIIIVKNDTRLGFAASLNIGLDMAKGKYIARMDDDDISLPTRFEEQVAYMESHPNIGMSGTAVEVFMNSNEVIHVETDPQKLKALLLVKTPFLHPTIVMRKDMLDKYNLKYDPNFFSEDYELFSRLPKCFDLGNIDKVLLRYRASGRSLTDSGCNERKIHDSHKRTMKNGFKNYLNLDMSDNELELLQARKDILNGRSNLAESVAMRQKAIDRILAANKSKCFYDQNALEEIFAVDKSVVVKSLVKRAAYPFYQFAKCAFKKCFWRVGRSIHWRFMLPFEHIEQRFEHMDISFEHMLQCFKHIEQRLNIIESLVLAGKKIWLVGLSQYKNIGDVAITLGARLFLRTYFSDFKCIELSQAADEENYAMMHKYIASGDIIVCMGGGNIGNLYIEADLIRQKIFREFPNNKVVVLPQSLAAADTAYVSVNVSDWLSLAELEYNRHKNLTVFARGESTLAFVKEHFSRARAFSAPDMALMLQYDFGHKRKGILTCIRDLNDESGNTQDEYRNIFKTIALFDPNYAHTNNLYEEDYGDTVYDAAITENHISRFATAEVVVTDRLHGMIMAVVAGTPCVALGGKTQKLKEFAPFLEKTGLLIFLDRDVSSLGDAIKRAYSLRRTDYDFTPLFEEMARIIKDTSI